jgi:SAM-dependent methyltransferase
MHAGYGILADVYDRWQSSYGKTYSELIFPRLLAVLRAHRIGGRSMVDVACGTGTLGLMMARRGWEVFGIDASAGMIEQAEAKAAASGLGSVHFLRQDMRTFRLPVKVALATSFFDSLNHLLVPEDLRSAFRSVREALHPGGWFLFDLNNERCFLRLWSHTDTVTFDGCSMILENSYDQGKRLATSHVILHLPGTESEQRKEETVCERCYPPEEVRWLLEDAGFLVRECVDFSFSHAPAIGKVKTWWVAETRP